MQTAYSFLFSVLLAVTASFASPAALANDAGPTSHIATRAEVEQILTHLSGTDQGCFDNKIDVASGVVRVRFGGGGSLSMGASGYLSNGDDTDHLELASTSSQDTLHSITIRVTRDKGREAGLRAEISIRPKVATESKSPLLLPQDKSVSRMSLLGVRSYVCRYNI